MAPPDCAVNPCTIERPEPGPFADALCGEERFRARANVSSLMPSPVSLTLMQTNGSCGKPDALPFSSL